MPGLETSMDYLRVDMDRILELAKSSPLEVLGSLRAQYKERLTAGDEPNAIRDLKAKLYWITAALSEAGAQRQNPGAQVHHEGLELDMSKELHLSLANAPSFESIDAYTARLPFIVSHPLSVDIGEYWANKGQILADKLRPSAIDHFKRTCGHALSNFWPTGFDSKVLDLWSFLIEVNDVFIHADKTEPTVSGQLSYLYDGDNKESIEGQELKHFRFYAFYTGLVWRRAVFEDELMLLAAIEESFLGNSYRIRKGSRLISQDLARSVTEYTLIKNANWQKSEPNSIGDWCGIWASSGNCYSKRN